MNLKVEVLARNDCRWNRHLELTAAWHQHDTVESFAADPAISIQRCENNLCNPFIRLNDDLAAKMRFAAIAGFVVTHLFNAQDARAGRACGICKSWPVRSS
jgi:hypothetical protein